MSIFSGKAILLTEGDSYYDPELVDMSSCAGIKCGGNMTMSGGYLAVYSMGAAGKGINCDGRLDLNGTSVVKVITEGTRAVQGGIKSSPKGISAEMGIKVDCDTLWVKAIGGEGSEGMDSKTSIIIERGEIALYCFDDCISTTNQIVVNGGRMYCYSSDNDGMDSKGTVEIHGGQVIAIGAPGTEEGIDYELDGFTVTGGGEIKFAQSGDFFAEQCFIFWRGIRRTSGIYTRCPRGKCIDVSDSARFQIHARVIVWGIFGYGRDL